MAFIDEILQTPSYGWMDARGVFLKPTTSQLFKEAFSRINVFRTRKNWITLISWFMAACMFPLFVIFLIYFLTWKTAIVLVVYAMVIMSTHGTIWFHRYCTHKSYRFSHPLFRLITQNLVIKTFPEEIYVISHHVHHVKSDEPGDPYNPMGGFMYCMLSDVNHQSISKDLSREKYQRVRNFLSHTGVGLNSFEQYQTWGSVSKPFYVISLWILNWTFWYRYFVVAGRKRTCSGLFQWRFFLVRSGKGI